ncbi:MAG: uracil-DNA glycosylase [Magnetovibrio sp.]|nr:uracil-DNA glycosylase [Magnetovibrio sp.]
MNSTSLEPDVDCALCPRLVDFRVRNQAKFPGFHNGPVKSFGPLNAKTLIVGLAPGLKGANCTGRPFTGDGAGELLYPTLIKFNLAKGHYKAAADDGLTLTTCRITNAVRCVPPENKVIGAETTACSSFLVAEITAMKNLTTIVSLGLVSHNAVLKAFGYKLSAYKFVHGAQHDLDNGLVLADSYHCTRYNTNTGRLTPQMFEDVFKALI